MWTTRSIEDDVLIEQRQGYCIAEYEPLQLKCEGGTEREARDALMLAIWSRVARVYEEYVQREIRCSRIPGSIKEVMDKVIDVYWQTHERKPIIKDVKCGIIEIELETND